MINRRHALALFCAPALVRASSLMPVKALSYDDLWPVPVWCPRGWLPLDGRIMANELMQFVNETPDHIKGTTYFTGIDWHNDGTDPSKPWTKFRYVIKSEHLPSQSTFWETSPVGAIIGTVF